MGYHKSLSFLCLLLASCAYTQRERNFFRKDYTYLESTNSFYKFHTIGTDYDGAKRTCQLEGSELFYAEDDNEAAAVLAFWTATENPIWTITVGIDSLILQGIFLTNNGDLISDVYDKWNSGEPNNAGAGESCVEMRRDGNLNDNSCDQKRPFVCKKTLSSLVWNYNCELPDTDYIYDPSVKKCYKFHLNPSSWIDSYAVCSYEQSSLALIQSPEENQALVALTARAPKDNIPGDYLRGAVHMGFLKTSAGWVTISGKKIKDSGFPDWVGGQPDNAGKNEVCGSMFYTGQLNDINCDTKMFFICQHDIDSNYEKVSGSTKKPE